MKERTINRNGRAMLAILSLMVVCALVCGGAAIRLFGDNVRAYAEQTADMVDTSPAIYVAEKNINSVVGVLTNTQTWDSVNGVTNQLVAQGSGVVIAEGGYILTNCHVIENGSAFQILMPSGEKVDATLVGSDSSMDLAVLKVNETENAEQLTPVTLGTTNELKVGSTVVAIGNPGGEVLANTVTQGIVSALERTSVNSSNASRRVAYIQHDAAINSGNSGGGLFNYRGELVGINTLKYSGSAYSSVTFEGLGFAIPVDTAYEIAQDLIEYGKVIRPALGISAANQSGPDEPLASNPPASVCIHEVTEGGAAEAAGLKQFDFIYKVDGERVQSMTDLTAILDQHEVGETVSVTVIRYNQAGLYQPTNNSIFSFGYGYSNSSAQLVVGGGYEEVTVDVVLEELQ